MSRSVLEGEELRLFVDGTAGFGHQASSLLVLESLISDSKSGGLGYRGRIAIVYTGGDQTRRKLAQLAPRFSVARDALRMGDATVTLHPVERPGALSTVRLGLTGGADRTEHRFPELTGTRVFLRLQPYGWADIWPTLADQVQFAGGRDGDLPLAEFPEVGARFAERCFLVPVPAASELGGASPIDDLRQRALAGLLDAADAGRIRLWPVYGIRTERPELRRPVAEMLFTLCCAALAHQEVRPGPPIVLVILDRVEVDAPDRPFDRLKTLLDGGPTQSEEDDRSPPDPARTGLARALGGADRVTMQFAQGLNGIELAGGRMLVANVRSTSAAMFRRCLAAAALPPVFEGNTTASIAISIGRPYLHVARIHRIGGEGPLAYSTLYPSAHVPIPDAERLARCCQEAARQITAPLVNWSAANTPPERLAEFLAAVAPGSGHELEGYFRAVAAGYSVISHDRLRLGLAAVEQFM